MTCIIKAWPGVDVLVDVEDHDYLSKFKWYIDGRGYAYRRNKVKGKYYTVKLHVILTGRPSGFIVDHINGNKLDNRKSNLRIATQTVNGYNSKLSKNNTSGFTGIQWRANRWEAKCKYKYKNIYLGRYKHIEEAISARNKFVNRVFQEEMKYVSASI